MAIGQVLWYIQGRYNANAVTVDGVGANTTAWTGPIAASIFQSIRSDNYNGPTPPTTSNFGTVGWYLDQPSGNLYANAAYLRGELVTGVSGAQRVEINKGVIDEVWSCYGHHKSFKGWYLSQECSRKTGKIINLYAGLGRYCKEVSGGLKTIISPYIDGVKNISQYNSATAKSGGVTLEEHAREWDEIFAGIRGAVDIVAFQDGHVAYEELTDFLKLNKSLADKRAVS